MALKLTVKQEKFCNKYLECGNASEAYRFAYDCKKMKDETINVKACQKIKEDKIRARIEEHQSRLQKKSDITKERILEELDAILEAKISDYVNLATKTVTHRQSSEEKKAGIPPLTVEVQSLEFKDFSELTERQIKAIESIKEGKNGIELKLHGKSWTIERICKMLGYDAPTQSEVRIANEFEHMTDEEIKNFIDNAEGSAD